VDQQACKPLECPKRVDLKLFIKLFDKFTIKLLLQSVGFVYVLLVLVGGQVLRLLSTGLSNTYWLTRWHQQAHKLVWPVLYSHVLSS
jgi:hypothetical protein